MALARPGCPAEPLADLQARSGDHRYAVAEVEAEIAQASFEEREAEQEVVRLRRSLAEASAWRPGAKAAEGQALRAEVEAQRLLGCRGRLEAELGAARGAAEELQGQLRALSGESSAEEDRAGRAEREAAALEAAAESCRRQLGDLEHQRSRLCDGYLSAGPRFEQAASASSWRRQEVEAELRSEIKRSERRAGRHRDCLGALEAELEAEEAEAGRQEAALEDRAVEASQLEQAVHAERARAQRLRAAAPAGAPAAAPRSPCGDEGQLVGMPLHLELLEEQAARFRERLQGLGWRQRLAAGPGGARGARPPAWLGPELEALEQRGRRAEAEARRAEEQRAVLARGVEEAHSHLGRLRRLADGERQAAREARREAAEARARAADAEDEAADGAAALRALGAGAASPSGTPARLEVLVEDQELRLLHLERRRGEQESECEARRAELRALREDGRGLARLQLEAQQGVEQLQRQQRRQSARRHRRRQLVCGTHALAMRHVIEARSALHLLRAEAEREAERLKAGCEARAREFLQRVEHHRAEQLAADAQAEERCAELRRQVDRASRGLEVSQHGLDELRAQAASLDRRRASEEEAAQELARRAALPVAAALAAFPADAALRAAAGELRDAQGPDGRGLARALELLRGGLRAAVGGARAGAEEAERARAELFFEAEARQEAALEAVQLAEAAARREAADERRAQLSSELQREQAAASRSAEGRARELARLEGEASALAAGLQGAELLARERRLQAEAREDRAAHLRLAAAAHAEGAAAAGASREPLRARLRELLEGLEQLQGAFVNEVAAQEQRWLAEVAERGRAWDLELAEAEAGLAAEGRGLRREAAAARGKEARSLEAAEQRATELQQQLRTDEARLADVEAARAALEGACESAGQEEHRARGLFLAAEARLSQARRGRQQALADLERRREGLQRQQDSALAADRRAGEARLARLRSALQETISGISASSLFDDTADEVVATEWRGGGGRPPAAAAAERARRRLGAGGAGASPPAGVRAPAGPREPLAR